MAKDFHIYEQDELVAHAESLTLTVGESYRKFKLKNIDILPNFHLINDSTNLYTVSFEAPNASGIQCQYLLHNCTISGRSRVSSSYNHLSYIEGNFDSLHSYPKIDEDNSVMTNSDF